MFQVDWLIYLLEVKFLKVTLRTNIDPYLIHMFSNGEMCKIRKMPICIARWRFPKLSFTLDKHITPSIQLSIQFHPIFSPNTIWKAPKIKALQYLKKWQQHLHSTFIFWYLKSCLALEILQAILEIHSIWLKCMSIIYYMKCIIGYHAHNSLQRHSLCTVL